MRYPLADNARKTQGARPAQLLGERENVASVPELVPGTSPFAPEFLAVTGSPDTDVGLVATKVSHGDGC